MQSPPIRIGPRRCVVFQHISQGRPAYTNRVLIPACVAGLPQADACGLADPGETRAYCQYSQALNGRSLSYHPRHGRGVEILKSGSVFGRIEVFVILQPDGTLTHVPWLDMQEVPPSSVCLSGPPGWRLRMLRACACGGEIRSHS